MKNDSRGIEWKVGLFMLVGLGLIAGMAIQFGKLGQGLKKYYMITAEFQNASGLLDIRVNLLALDILVAGNPVDDADQFLWVHKFILVLAIKLSRLVASC